MHDVTEHNPAAGTLPVEAEPVNPAVPADSPQPGSRLELARADLAEAVGLLGQAGITYKAIAEAADYRPNVVSRLLSRVHNSEIGPTAICRLTRAVSNLYPAAAAETLDPAATARLGELTLGLTERFGDIDRKGPELSPEKHRLVYGLASYMLDKPACTVSDPRNAGRIIRRDLKMTDKEWPVAYRYLTGLGLITARKKSPRHKAYSDITFEAERLLLIAQHLERTPAFIDDELLERARRKVPEMEQKRAQEGPAETEPAEEPAEEAGREAPAVPNTAAWAAVPEHEQKLPDVPNSELDMPPRAIEQRPIRRRHYAGLAHTAPTPPRREPPRQPPARTPVPQPSTSARRSEFPQAPAEPEQPPARRTREAVPESEKERRIRQRIEVDCFRIAIALTDEAMTALFGGLDPMLKRLSKHTGGLDTEVLDARRKYMMEQGWATFTVDDKGARFALTAKGEQFRNERLAKAARRARAAQAQNPQ